MTVSELVTILQTMPQDLPVEVNDNGAGNIHEIYSVDHFDWSDLDPDGGDEPGVYIQVNC